MGLSVGGGVRLGSKSLRIVSVSVGVSVDVGACGRFGFVVSDVV